MILATACWICLFTLCQSKYIEVNNNTANDSTVCCIEGTCLCRSFYEALIHVESDTVINITSSITLHNNVTSLRNLNNITIIGNGITIACNNSEMFKCTQCSNVAIKGITWDQCGDPSHPYITYAFFLKNVINISIIGCTFQYSKVCTAVYLMLVSGFVEVQDSRFLFNYMVNSSQCPLFATLAIVDGENGMMQNATVLIAGTLFYQNGAFDYAKYNGNKLKPTTLLCLLTIRPYIIFYSENLTIFTSFGCNKL